jgi:hypothetical protein
LRFGQPFIEGYEDSSALEQLEAKKQDLVPLHPLHFLSVRVVGTKTCNFTWGFDLQMVIANKYAAILF